MGTLVQKFGGSSVAGADKLRACARHVVAARRRGERVVVVVSAMGDATDELIALAETVTQQPDRRELDQMLATGEQVSIAMMALTLKSLGVPALSLTGAQAAIQTDDAFGRASIQAIDAQRLSRLLDQDVVPVVAGFQGVTPAGEVTTLGRGGSDTTAVALAAALRGSALLASSEPEHRVACEIYKDVDGVYTDDPRIVPGARRLLRVRYDEMLEAAALGAQVLHPRAVEMAQRFGVPVRVVHSQTHDPSDLAGGTWVVGEDPAMEARAVASVVLKRNVGRISLRGVPNVPGVQAKVFAPLAARLLPIDDIIQEDDGPSTINLTWTMDKRDLLEAAPIVHEVAGPVGAQALRIDGAASPIAGASGAQSGLVTLSAVGAGMRTTPGVAATMFEALAQKRIKVENITTSEIRISCVLAEADGEAAARAVHEAFGLG